MSYDEKLMACDTIQHENKNIKQANRTLQYGLIWITGILYDERSLKLIKGYKTMKTLLIE